MADHPNGRHLDDRERERWNVVADGLSWTRPFDEIYHPNPPYGDWFVGGELNLSANCVDRHARSRPDHPAMFWEGEPGDRRRLTYAELHREMVRLSACLQDLGVTAGDRVALHLGWLPETVAAMLACARLGAVHTVVPMTLPVEALALRLSDFSPRVLFTQDGGWRHGAILPMKARADEALESTTGVQHTVVVRRTGIPVEWFEGDLWYDELMTSAAEADEAPPSFPAGLPVATVHLANQRGRPVSVQLGVASMAVVALANHRYVMGEGDVFWAAADVAWLGAQAHGIIGPLLAGSSAVMYEGTLDVPDPARTWQIVERYGVNSLVTTPSIVRALRSWSLAVPAGLESLCRIVTIGERLEPELREWLSRSLEDVVVADGWGQLELGGIVACDHPIDRSRMPDPGFEIVDAAGRPVPDGEAGEWVMVGPWPGTMRGIDAGDVDPTAYHWTRHPGRYATGDLARRVDGRIEYLGRVDEVVSVSGQLVSLTEVREVLLDQPFVLAAEVVERGDAGHGRSVAAAVVLRDEAPRDAASLRELQDGVRDVLGGLSRPRALLVVDRFGDDLDAVVRRRALARVAAMVRDEPLSVTWEEVLRAADVP